MKRVSVVAFAMVVVAGPASAQPRAFRCAAEGDHERRALKTRLRPRSLARARTVSLRTMLDWKIPAAHSASEIDAIPPRERKLYTVTGVVRKIELSGEDCDLHLELADSGRRGAPRVIVEIPAAQAALQKKASAMFNLSVEVHSHVYDGDGAKRVAVTGYAFLDLSHQCADFPKAGCRHGGDRVRTLWEIHPVL